MGEIGIPRREFLYDIQFWEVRRIIRGYRKRDRLKHQLMAECVYATTFAMRDPKGKTVADMFPSLFAEDTSDFSGTEITEDDVQDLQADMAAFNAQHADK